MEFILNGGGAAKPDGGGAKAATGDAAQVVKDGDVTSFMQDVVEASLKVPVIVDFWAPWCGPCKQLGPVIEKLVRQAGGLVRLVKINIDENQELAAQMRVQSIPAVYAFHGGRPVDGFVGVLPESQVRQFVDRLLGDAKPPIERALEQAQAMLAAGDFRGAAALCRQILGEDPAHPAATAGLIRAHLAADEVAEAERQVAKLSPEIKAQAEVAAAVAAVELAVQGKASGNTGELRQRLAADPADHQARFDLAVALYGGGDSATAIEELLELVRRDRGWKEAAARKQLIKIFEALGPANPLTLSGRRRLSSMLFS